MRSRLQPMTVVALSTMFAASAWFIARDAVHYLVQYSEGSYGAFWPKAAWMRSHAGGGVLVLVAGFFQFVSALAGVSNRYHRWGGRLYLAGVAFAASAAVALLVSGSVVGPLFGAVLFLQTVLWVVFSLLGWIAARRRQWLAHRQWMARSFALAMGFVLFRLLASLPVLEDWPLPERFTTLQALLLPALLATTELFLQWRGAFGATAAPRSRALS